MKFLPLFWSGIWRKPGRTALIFLQVSVAFALFGMLQGLKTGVDHAAAAARADLLIVHSRLSFLAVSLPVGSLDQIKSVPGVKLVVPVDIFGATYQKATQRLGVVAIGLVKDWPSAFTFTIAPEYLAAFQKLRTAALVRKELAEKYGWKIGDFIPLMSHTAQMDGSTDWAFDVVGTFGDSDVGSGPDNILINLAYLEEARFLGKGTVQHFNVAISDPQQGAAVSDEIDRRFANSSQETKTESLLELAHLRIDLSAAAQRIGAVLTITIGVACAVGVLVSMLAMGIGMQRQAIENVRADRVILSSTGARGNQSSIPRDEAVSARDLPGIRKDATGVPIAIFTALIPIEAHRRATGIRIFFPLVGTTANLAQYRPEIRITSGRMFRPGLHELIASNACRREFTGFEIGERRPIRGVDWTVVGNFDEGHALQCVVYADVDVLMSTFNRNTYNQVSVMLQSAQAGAVVASILCESLLFALPGALLGGALAWVFFSGLSASPFGYNFQLAVTPSLALIGVAWALAMGLVGGLLPALRAARLPVATALRAA